MSGYPSGHEILILAQQGHPTALATILGYIAQPQRIKVRAQRQNERLYVLLEAAQPPLEPAAIELVQNSLRELQVTDITTVNIYGRQQGDRLPAWQKTIYLETESYWLPAQPFSLPTDLPTDAQGDSTLVEAVTVERDSLPSIPNALPPMESSDTPFILDETDRLEAVFESEPAALDKSDSPELLKRPESVIFLIFISLLLFWEAYLSLLEESEPSAQSTVQAHSTSQLARRLHTAKGTIRRRKYAPDFSEWTQGLDPDGIAWNYQRGLYVPQLDNG